MACEVVARAAASDLDPCVVRVASASEALQGHPFPHSVASFYVSVERSKLPQT